MTGTANRLARLRGRSYHELWTRGRQALASALERHRLPALSSSAGSLPADALNLTAERGSLFEHFRNAAPSRFFAGLDDRDATVRALRQLAPDAEARVIARARDAAAGRFTFLGHRKLSFGDPIDWWLDPTSGRRAPDRHWSRIPYLDPRVVGDHKVVWELNRHQHFVTLGQAYWYTGDESFARAFADQLSSWLAANPAKVGINWASSLEVAFRSISWLWALHFFRESAALTPALFDRAIASLHVHGSHLETYLSTYFSPNTHLTGEALGLYYLGVTLPGLRSARRWKAAGARILMEQMRRQVRNDGVYFEQATCYHRYTTEFYLHLLLLAGRNEADPAPTRDALAPTLTALLDCMMMLQRPDRSLPLLGDDDGGQLVLLDDRAVCDVRAALGLGAALFDRADYRHAAGDPGPAAVWLLGPAAASRMFAAPAEAPPATSHALHDGGWFVMRDGWRDDSSYLLVDCGRHGAEGCGHAHADALSFEVVSHGRPMLVDPGTFTYTADPAARDEFRQTTAHNALTLDGLSSSEPSTAFRWARIADGRLDAWVSCERLDFLAGHHDGFAHLPGSPRVRRSVLFIRGDYWVVRDQVESSDAHWIRLGYQCAATVRVAHCGERHVELRAEDGTGLVITVASGAGRFAVAPGAVSPTYGTKVPAPRIEFTAQAQSGADITMVMIPLASGAIAPTVDGCADGERPVAFTIRGESYSDTLAIGGRSGSEERIGPATEWTWVRCDPAGNARERGTIRGTRVTIDRIALSGANGHPLVALRDIPGDAGAAVRLVRGTPPAVAGSGGL